MGGGITTDPPAFFRALAIDFDGTLAQGGSPGPDVLRALRHARSRGLRLVLVTGRILGELEGVFPDVRKHFDALVLENGAVLETADSHARPLAPRVEPELVKELQDRGVPVRCGDVLMALTADYEEQALQVVTELGLKYALVRNRNERMLLPADVTKGSGVCTALEDLELSTHNAIAIGDAENDLSFFSVCELAVAVRNAVPALKEHADLVLPGDNGTAVAGFLEEKVLTPGFRKPSERRRIELGRYRDDSLASVAASQINLLVTGRSISGKSYATGLVAERLIKAGYSVCLLDPEGDHATLGNLDTARRLGGAQPLPQIADYEELLQPTAASLIVDLSLLPVVEQNDYTARLQQALARQRATLGRPQWIVMDEAHRLPFNDPSLDSFRGYCLASYEPSALGPKVWETLDAVLALGGGVHDSPQGDPIVSVEQALGVEIRSSVEVANGSGTALLHRSEDFVARPLSLLPRNFGHVRHWHKYARSDLPPELRFHFQWEEGFDTAAHTIEHFHELIDRCPAAVIRYHAHRGDFSRWFRELIQDREIADDIHPLEYYLDQDPSDLAVVDFRQRLGQLIERRYFE